jgi:hypothetical protein
MSQLSRADVAIAIFIEHLESLLNLFLINL